MIPGPVNDFGSSLRCRQKLNYNYPPQHYFKHSGLHLSTLFPLFTSEFIAHGRRTPPSIATKPRASQKLFMFPLPSRLNKPPTYGTISRPKRRIGCRLSRKLLRDVYLRAERAFDDRNFDSFLTMRSMNNSSVGDTWCATRRSIG